MNMMYWLWLGAIVMLVLSLAVLLPPLLKEHAAPQATLPNEATLRALYKTQLAELEQERTRGNLADAEHAQAVDELHRRLLLELDRSTSAGRWQHNPWLHRGSALLLAVLLPVAALALYQKVGDPRAAAQLAQATDNAHGSGADGSQIQGMVDGLADRLKAEPQNLGGWIMLARSYETLERFNDAANAYEQALKEAQRSKVGTSAQAQLLADQADALASAQGGDLTGPAGAAVDRALQLDPTQPKALALAGAAAARKGNLKDARQHWQALLAQLEPGSDVALRVQDDLLKLEGVDTSVPSSTVGALGLSLSGQVSIDANAKLSNPSPTSKIFVVVRTDSRAAPVAVLRASADQLPLTFHIGKEHLLDPSFNLTPSMGLTVQARLSQNGEAMPQSGDLYSDASPVNMQTSDIALQLRTQ